MKFYESVFKGSKQQEKPKYPDLPQTLQTKFHKNDGKPANEKKASDLGSNLRDSVFLKNKVEQEEQGCLKKMCACTQIEYYKDYFKVTNDDVKKRMMCNLKFWQGSFFQPADQDYDFYGPFWIHTTVVFCLGAVHNILQYQAKPNYDQNFQIIGQAFFAMYALGFGLPIAIGFIMKALGINLTIIQILCLYGYSSSVYILCIILCSFNICLVHWILMGYACAHKIYFVFKNIQDGFQIPVSKKLIVTIMIIVEGVLQFFIFKIRFINCADSPALTNSALKHLSEFDHQNGGNFLHFRYFEDSI